MSILKAWKCIRTKNSLYTAIHANVWIASLSHFEFFKSTLSVLIFNFGLKKI